MTDKILFVDDEVQILNSMKRQLRKRFSVETAQSGKEALKKFKEEGPFAVVVSDMRMPEMDGIQLLSSIKDMYPDTVRLMLTGNADQETATEAVNKGQIFRFLTKPCSTPLLITSLALALRQYRLVTAEKELIDKTLKGSIKVLSELLSFTSPTAFSSGVRIRSLVIDIGNELGIENRWELEIAALLSQIGCITLPHELLNKLFANIALDEEESEMYENHPQFGASLLENIPRLENVSYIIKNQRRKYLTFQVDDPEKEDLNLCAQILKTVFDYDLLRYHGTDHSEAIRQLFRSQEDYNPLILKELQHVQKREKVFEIVSLRVKDLAIGMYVEENIIAKNGTLLAPKGQEITGPVLQGLQNFSRQVGVMEPVHVRKTKPSNAE